MDGTRQKLYNISMSCHTPTIYDFKTLDEQKKFLRKRAKTALKEYCADGELMKECGKSVLGAVENWEIFKKADLILGFMPMGDELPVEGILLLAGGMGKKVCIPKMCGQSCDMDFYFMKDEFFSGYEESSRHQLFSDKNKYGILEPGDDWEKFTLSGQYKNILMLVPGLAFNLEGDRLGRGKGFYDRFLEKFEGIKKSLHWEGNFTTVGCTFTICITKAIPVGENDRKVNFILNEYGLSECKKSPALK